MANPKQERKAADRDANKDSHGTTERGANRERNIGHRNAEEHNRSGQHNDRPTGPRKK